MEKIKQEEATITTTITTDLASKLEHARRVNKNNVKQRQVIPVVQDKKIFVESSVMLVSVNQNNDVAIQLRVVSKTNPSEYYFYQMILTMEKFNSSFKKKGGGVLKPHEILDMAIKLEVNENVLTQKTFNAFEGIKNIRV
jgi:small-conductance mechanosensitive channel